MNDPHSYIYICVCVCVWDQKLEVNDLPNEINELFNQLINNVSASDFPCNYLPCLQMDDGYMMPETMAICRYLAREYSKYLQPDNIYFYLITMSIH